jgi:CheY-like chemotaxis protein
MKGLLIEDEPSKAKKIVKWFKKEMSNIEIQLESSYQTGLKAIFSANFDFILLDMSLSSYVQYKGNFSGKPKVFGGSDILKEMRRHGKKINRDGRYPIQ